MTDETAAPTPHPEDQRDTYADLTARLAAADLGWSHEHGDPPANLDYVKRLAFQIMAFQPPLIAGVYVDDAMHNRMRDRLHGDRCGCGEWDSHSGEYIDQMDATIHAVLYPLRHPVRPVSQGTEDSPEHPVSYLSQRAVEITAKLHAAGFEPSVQRQVLGLAEEVGEFVGAYRRWSGQARRSGTKKDMHLELADVVITAYVAAVEMGFDLDAAINDKLAIVFSRGWREEAS